MKKEIRQKVVKYPVYVADDGKVFDNREDALIHDKLIHGKIKECPECHGKFRCHCGSNRWPTEDQFALDFEIFVRCSANKEEVINKVQELEKED